eukprot:4846614-Alexandrium_andersonii.AAC.1
MGPSARAQGGRPRTCAASSTTLAGLGAARVGPGSTTAACPRTRRAARRQGSSFSRSRPRRNASIGARPRFRAPRW